MGFLVCSNMNIEVEKCRMLFTLTSHSTVKTFLRQIVFNE